MAIIQKVKVGDEWVKVSSSNNSESSSSGTDIFVINSDKDFEVIEDGSLAGIILDPNTTYNDIKNAIDNNYNIALKEPRGNLSYCLRADFVLENQESGNKRIALFFTKSILSIRYDIILYIGLNNSILYMISKNDIFSKKEVEESIDNKAPYVGKEEPTTDTVLWIDPTGTPSGGNGGGTSGGGSNVYVFPEHLFASDNPAFTTEEAEEFKNAVNDIAHTTFVVMIPDGETLLKVTCTSAHRWDIGEGEIQYSFMGTYFMVPDVSYIQCVMPVVLVSADGSVTIRP